MRTIVTRDATSLAEILGSVSEWMARGVLPLPVTSRMPAAEAARLLERAGARRAWVVEHGEVVGAVTLPALRAHGHELVADCMLSTILTVRADWPLTRAAIMLRQAGTDAVVVTDRAGRPVGILSSDDLVRAVAGRALITLAGRGWAPRTW